MDTKIRKKSKVLLVALLAVMLFAITFSAIHALPNTQSALAFDGDPIEFEFDEDNLNNSNIDYSLLTWDDFEYLFTLERNYRIHKP